VNEAVANKVVKYCTMLRAWKIHIYHSTVIGHFQQLVSGTELGKKFERPDGSWDVLKNDNNEEAAAENPKPKMIVFDRLERAAQLAPHGEKISYGQAPRLEPPPSPRVGNPGGAPPPNGTAVTAPLDVNRM